MKDKTFKEKPFLSGYRLGVAAALLSARLQELRLLKKVLREDVAKATGIPLDIITGLELTNLKTFLNLEVITLAKLASYFNVTLDIKMLLSSVPASNGKLETFMPSYKEIDITSKDRV